MISGPGPEKPDERLHRLHQKRCGLRVGEIADVRARERLAADDQAAGALEVAPHGEDARSGSAGDRRQRHRLRHESAAAAQQRSGAGLPRAPPSRRLGCGSAGRAAGTSPRFRRELASASSFSRAIGSSARFPLVMTRAGQGPSSSRWWSGV